jgi:hypothetical protein
MFQAFYIIYNLIVHESADFHLHQLSCRQAGQLGHMQLRMGKILCMLTSNNHKNYKL